MFEQIEQVIFPKDFIKLKLTGEISLEVSDASGSYLFDVKHRRWSDEMFELCNLPRHIVSDNVIESQEIAGYLKKDVAEELGLMPNIPVVGGAGDQPACGLGSGVYKEGIVSATIGTSGVVYAAANLSLIHIFIIASIRNGGTLIGINPFILDILVGALIVISVLFDQLQKSKSS